MKGLKALGGSFLINLSVGFGYAILISRVLGVENRGLVYSYQLPSLFIATLVFSIASQPVFELTKNTTNSRVSSITIALTLLSCSLFSLIKYLSTITRRDQDVQVRCDLSGKRI